MDTKIWFNNLSPRSITSIDKCFTTFFPKYFRREKLHGIIREIHSFAQLKDENLPTAWERFSELQRIRPCHGIKDHVLLDIFYSGLTMESRSYLDSFVGDLFRNRTIVEAKELLDIMTRNYCYWNIEEETPIPIPKKRGVLALSEEDEGAT